MNNLIGDVQNNTLKLLITFFLSLLLFTLPLSSTGKSICLGLTVCSILSVPDYRESLITLFLNEWWCKAALLLFFLAVMACLWSAAEVYEKLVVIEKYSKLIYLPILAIGFASSKTRNWGLHSFLAAIVIVCLLSILKKCGYLPSLEIKPDYVFRNHIITGWMVSFSAYLACLLYYRNQGIIRVLYIVAFLLFSYHVLFISEGRAGYITYLLLMSLLIVQHYSWRQIIAGFILVCTLFSICYIQSPIMKERTQEIIQDLKDYQHDKKDTSVGYRLQFYNFAYNLFNQHPIRGNGTGSFTYNFRTQQPILSWTHRLWEPHSQYWLVASEFGLIGVVLLLGLFFILFKTSLRLNEMKAVALAMLLSFSMGNLSDSLLFYSGSGYFFIFFMALSLGEIVNNKPSNSAKT